MEERLAKRLMAYRTTPQSTTSVTPAELLQGMHKTGHVEALLERPF